MDFDFDEFAGDFETSDDNEIMNMIQECKRAEQKAYFATCSNLYLSDF